MNDSNVEYYNKNADSFFEGSVAADMSYQRDKFASLLPKNARVLDVGCGSGRDSKAFMDRGFDVISFDASEEMCKRASAYIGREVLNMRFEEISFDNKFDGIWACASLLHVSKEKLPEILGKLRASLKDGGVMYASFKYGDGVKERGERSFIDFNEKSIVPVMESAGFTVIGNEVTHDIRPGRGDEMWINVIGRN